MKQTIRVLSALGIAAGLAAALAAGESGKRADEIRRSLGPLQVVVGQWRGNTFRGHVVHPVEWRWDHRSDPESPALVMDAPKNPFFGEARLSFDPEIDKFLLRLEEPNGSARSFTGEYSESPKTAVGDDGQTLQRTFEIAFEQTAPKSGLEWRIVLNQQENNRFLIELERRRGTAPFRRFDTVSNQRKGTSFAITREGYGEKTCIISGGLGTIPVSHEGRTYYVCCSGCKAAFEEDPEGWLAAAKERAAQE